MYLFNAIFVDNWYKTAYKTATFRFSFKDFKDYVIHFRKDASKR